MELKDATAEVIQQENPAAAQAIADEAAKAAVTAERERIAKIRKLTRKGAKWEAMRDKAIEDGTSPDAYLEAVIAEEEKAGAAFLEARTNETKPAEKVGAGDTTDLDNGKEAEEKAAKEIAEMAKDMSADTTEMA